MVAEARRPPVTVTLALTRFPRLERSTARLALRLSFTLTLAVLRAPIE
jgi:hypothetical protein